MYINQLQLVNTSNIKSVSFFIFSARSKSVLAPERVDLFGAKKAKSSPTWGRVFKLLARQTIHKKRLRSKQLRLDHATKLSKAQGRLIRTLRKQLHEMREVYTTDVNKLHAENASSRKEIEEYYSSQMCEKTKEMVEMRFAHSKECVKLVNTYEQKLFTKSCEIEELKEDLRHKSNNVSELLGHVAFLEHSFKGE